MKITNSLLMLSIAVVGVFLNGCGPSTTSTAPDAINADVSASKIESVIVQLNWYPEAEHGGVFQAKAEGVYEAAGLNVQIRPGGRATPVAPELQLGRVQFAFANADDVVTYRREGLDIVAVAAAMQDSPRCILVQEASGVKDFTGLAGMTLQRQAGRPFLEFMRSKGILDQVKEVPYHGSVTSLVSDKNIAIQAYSFAEPLLAEQQGVKVRRLMVSDLGWNPYASVLVTTGDMIRERPDLVRKFVQATCSGWQRYMTDPSLGNEAILAANEHGMTAEALEYGVKQLRTLVIPPTLEQNEIGKMSPERWRTLVTQMDVVSASPSGVVTAEQCFSLDFLPVAELETDTEAD